MQTLLDRSHSLQIHMDKSSPSCQAAEFQKLRHQHAQLLDFNHVLIEENNHRLVDHAELMSEVEASCYALKACLVGTLLLAAALTPHPLPAPFHPPCCFCITLTIPTVRPF